MVPESTPAVVRALEAAQKWAGRAGSAEVQAIHLLAGLLDEEEGRVAGLWRRTGLDRTALLNRFSSGDEKGCGPAARLDQQAAWAVAEANRRASKQASDCTVTTEHLFQVILEIDGLPAAAGIDSAKRDALLPTGEPTVKLDDPLDLPESAEWIGAARVLDAAGNRAREGLRVVEDYCRFVLDDVFLTGELKRLRHDLAEALARLSSSPLLEARDTPTDVGTALTTEREQTRQSVMEVVQANLKRLQEALRSLEEFGKLHGPELGQALEQLRYRSYTLERAILLGTTARQRLAEARLYVLLSSASCVAALDWTIQEAAAGGAETIQLREKDLSDQELLDRAREVRRWTRQAGVLFIMNDRADIARLAEADGVHLGQDDLPVKEARRILGPDRIVGVSTHNLDQLRQAILDGASYVGVGPTFPSGTKEFAELAGLEYVRQALAETTLPAFVIGGVNLQTIEPAIAAGARRVAVSQAIAQADEPRRAAAQLRRLLEEALRQDSFRPDPQERGLAGQKPALPRTDEMV